MCGQDEALHPARLDFQSELNQTAAGSQYTAGPPARRSQPNQCWFKAFNVKMSLSERAAVIVSGDRGKTVR